MRHLNLDQLQTLVAIADLGTFAAAAQALHLAPPTVSMHVKELETRLDTTLVLRGRRRAELTVTGQALVAEGRQLLLASRDLVESVHRHASGREGIVKVGVSAGLSTRLLPLVLARLTEHSPGVDIRLEAVSSALSMSRLKAGTLDIGIVASPQPPMSEVTLMPWREDDMVALLPAAWQAPDQVSPHWLSEQRWASFAPATQMHGLISAWFGRAGYQPQPYLTMSYPGALKSLAMASQSAAILPYEEVADYTDAPEVQIRRLTPPLKRTMAIAHRRAPMGNPAIAKVISVLTEFGTHLAGN